jgi:hypothetical protein
MIRRHNILILFKKQLSRFALQSLLALALTCPVHPADTNGQRAFATAEEAVRALTTAAKAGNTSEILAIFGPEANDIVSSLDPIDARRNREIFVAAVAEEWKLADQGEGSKELSIGYEQWPFPVPLVKNEKGWVFDTAAGKDEVLARQIGRNELATIEVCKTYVNAQQEYSAQAHDGKPAGLFAQKFASDPGLQNGLYWQAKTGERRSPLGELVAQASQEGRGVGTTDTLAPFHGYLFRILTGQGSAASGGATNYLVNGEMSGGFALVAWPAAYDSTGIMTFVVSQEGIIYQKDLGNETSNLVKSLTLYDPDKTWNKAE